MVLEDLVPALVGTVLKADPADDGVFGDPLTFCCGSGAGIFLAISPLNVALGNGVDRQKPLWTLRKEILMKRPEDRFFGVSLPLLIAVAILAGAGGAQAQPAVSWEPNRLVVDAVAGGVVRVEATFVASRHLLDLEIVVVPSLAEFVSVSPSSVAEVLAGEAVTVEATIRVDAAESSGTIGGTLQVRHSGRPPRVYARPLPVKIEVVPGQDPPPHWEVPADLCLRTRPALGDDGLFYATVSPTCDSGLMGPGAVEPHAGTFLWGPAIPPGCDQHPRNPPRIAILGVSVAANGLIFAVGDWNQCRNGRLVAYSPNGALFRDHGDCPGGGNTSPHPRQVPAIDDAARSVFFGSRVLCSVDEDTVFNNWTAGGGHYIGGRGIAVDREGNVYYSTHSGAVSPSGKTRSFTASGALRWNRDTGGIAGPEIQAIVGHRLLLFQEQAGNSLLAWHKDTGLDLPGEAWPIADLARPVVDGQGMLYASRVAIPEVVALNQDGSIRWAADLSAEGVSSVAVDFVDASGRLFARGDSSLFALSTSSGRLLWRFDAGATLHVPAALTPDGEIFLADLGATIYVLQTATDYAASEWPIALHGNRRHTAKANDLMALP